MKKILTISLFLLFLVVGVFLYFIDRDGNLGKGSYFIYYASPDIIKSTSDKNIYIGDILEVKYNNYFIIACRVPAKFYNCPNSNPVEYENYLEYLIIDKNSNNIYVTKSYDRFIKKISNDDMNLTFNKNDISLIRRKFTRNKQIYDYNNSLFECKEIHKLQKTEF